MGAKKVLTKALACGNMDLVQSTKLASQSVSGSKNNKKGTTMNNSAEELALREAHPLYNAWCREDDGPEDYDPEAIAEARREFEEGR